MARAKGVNPFYILLMLVGVVFAITACAYGVMTVKLLDPWQLPEGEAEGGVLAWLDRHGLMLLTGELVVLAILTAAAMMTDDYWMRRAQPRSVVSPQESTRSKARDDTAPPGAGGREESSPATQEPGT